MQRVKVKPVDCNASSVGTISWIFATIVEQRTKNYPRAMMCIAAYKGSASTVYAMFDVISNCATTITSSSPVKFTQNLLVKLN